MAEAQDFKPKSRKLIIKDADAESDDNEPSVEAQLSAVHGRETRIQPAGAAKSTRALDEKVEKTVELQDKLKENDDLEAALKSTLGPKLSNKPPTSKPAEVSPAPASPKRPVPAIPASTPSPPKPASSTRPAPAGPSLSVPDQESLGGATTASTQASGGSGGAAEDLAALSHKYKIPIDKVARKMHRSHSWLWLIGLLIVGTAAIVAVFWLKPELADILREWLENLSY